MEITATINGRVKTITESSIRRHLKLEDSDGIPTLPNAKIYEQLALMGPKKTAWEQFISNIATTIIYMETNRTFNFSKMIFEGMLKNLDSRSKFLMYPRFIQIFLNKHTRHLLPHKRTYVAPTLTQKLFSNIRRVSKGYTRVNIPLFETMLTAPESSPSRITSSPSLSPQTHPSTSQQPPTPPFMQTIHDTEEPATMPHDSSQPRVQSLGSDEGSLTLNELTVLCTTLSKKVEDLQNNLKQTKLTYGATYTKLILRIKKLEHKVKSSKSIRRTKIVVSDDEEVLEDPSKQGRIIAEIDQNPSISLGEKEISTANISVSTAGVSTTKAVLTVIPEVSTAIPERQVYIRRSAEKRKDKGKTIMEDDESSDPTVLRYHAQQNRSFSKAKVKKNMCMYLKNQGGYKQSHFRGMSYEDIRPIFERVWDQNQAFVPKASEIEKEVMKRSGFDLQQKQPAEEEKLQKNDDSSKPSGGNRKKTLARKRASEKQSEEGAKRQKKEDDIEKEELKPYLDIVPGEEFAMDVESLSTKYPIVDWKIHILTDNFMYYQIIKADGSSKNYKIFSEMIDDFDKQDVMHLHRLIYKITTLEVEESLEESSLTVVANSTTEAEYLAASSRCGQVLWIQNQLPDYGSGFKTKTVNGEVQLQALVDGKKIIITESIVRRDLQLEDAEGVDCLPNSTIFEHLTLMGMVKNLDHMGKFFMYPRFIQVFLDKQLEGMPTHNRIYIAPSHTKKIFGNIRRVGKGFSGRETPLFQTMVVQDQAKLGEASANPTDPHHTPTFIQPQKKQKPRKPKKKDTQIPKSSGPTEHVADEAVYKELDDSLVRAATTASSLEAEQDSGNIAKTRSKATPNESSSLGTTSGGDTLRSGKDSLKLNEFMELCTNLQTRVLDLKNTKTQAEEIVSLKRRVKKLEQKKRSRTHRLKRLYKVGLTARVESSEDEESLGADASKQERINVIDADEDINLVNDQDDADMFNVNTLTGDEVLVEPEVAVKDVNLIVDEVTLAQALAALKSVKPKVKADVIEEPSVPVSAASTKVSAATTTTTVTIPTPRKGIVITELGTSTTTTISSQPSQAKVQDKGKGIMVEEPVNSIKRKIESGLIKKLLQKWDDIQAKVKANYQLAQRLQAEEQKQFTTKQKATLFKELLEQRRKHFATKRADEKRNKPPTQSQ
ncbi:hypothetical protein Tco_0782427 [Tanacetum coccineum]